MFKSLEAIKVQFKRKYNINEQINIPSITPFYKVQLKQGAIETNR